MEKIPQRLLENPWRYICNHYEGIYPHMGRAVFSVASLIPVSLIMPKIPSTKKLIKQKINLFLISPPGTGKTSIAEELEKITYNPLFTEHITPARLNREINSPDRENITLIISDVANSLNNEELVKFIEGALGDEGATSRSTMKNTKEDMRKKKDVVSYMAGTPDNISNDRIRRGFLSRMSPLICVHTLEEHNEILDYVNDSIGEYNPSENESEAIVNFYQNLREIQEETHESINKIKSFIIPKEFTKEIGDFIKPRVVDGFEEFGIEAIRQTHEAYRFMCAHAFLDIHNKYKNGKIKDNKIIIERKDVDVSKYLIDIEIETIFIIAESISLLNDRGIKTLKQLREWERGRGIREKKKLSREKDAIMRGYVKK